MDVIKCSVAVAALVHYDNVSGLNFWSQRQASYSMIQPLAEDMLAAAASQAFLERVFLLCRLLTTGRRNRMSHSLEMCAFLKLNAHVF